MIDELNAYFERPGDIPGSRIRDLMTPAELSCFEHGWKAALAKREAAVVKESLTTAASAEVPEGYALVEVSFINDEWLTAAMKEADIARRVCSDDDVVLHAAIHGYLLAAMHAAQRQGGAE